MDALLVNCSASVLPPAKVFFQRLAEHQPLAVILLTAELNEQEAQSWQAQAEEVSWAYCIQETDQVQIPIVHALHAAYDTIHAALVTLSSAGPDHNSESSETPNTFHTSETDSLSFQDTSTAPPVGIPHPSSGLSPLDNQTHDSSLFQTLTQQRQQIWSQDTGGVQDFSDSPITFPIAWEAKAKAPRRNLWTRKAANIEQSTHALVLGRKVLFLGMHGGAGVTTLTLLTALQMGNMGLSVGIVELPQQGGQLLRLLRQPLVRQGVEAQVPPKDLATRVPPRLIIMPHGIGPGSLIGQVDPTPYVHYLEKHCDIILIDGGAQWATPACGQAYELADAIIPITEPTALGLGSCVRFEEFSHGAGIDERIDGVILNKRGEGGLGIGELHHNMKWPIIQDIHGDAQEFNRWTQANRWSPTNNIPPTLLTLIEPLAKALIIQRRNLTL